MHWALVPHDGSYCLSLTRHIFTNCDESAYVRTKVFHNKETRASRICPVLLSSRRFRGQIPPICLPFGGKQIDEAPQPLAEAVVNIGKEWWVSRCVEHQNRLGWDGSAGSGTQSAFRRRRNPLDDDLRPMPSSCSVPVQLTAGVQFLCPFPLNDRPTLVTVCW